VVKCCAAEVRCSAAARTHVPAEKAAKPSVKCEEAGLAVADCSGRCQWVVGGTLVCGLSARGARQ